MTDEAMAHAIDTEWNRIYAGLSDFGKRLFDNGAYRSLFIDTAVADYPWKGGLPDLQRCLRDCLQAISLNHERNHAPSRQARRNAERQLRKRGVWGRSLTA